MAAYANLVSLMNLIEQIQLYNTHHPSFLHEHQNQLKSLHEKVINLQELLEWCSVQGFNETCDLESRITDATIGAEDIIEHYIVGDISGRLCKELIMIYPNTFMNVHETDTILFSEELRKVIECMDLMEKEMMNIKEESVFENQMRLLDLQPTGPPGPHLDWNNDMVGFEDEKNEIMNQVIGHGSSLKIISIIGMGGIGKSTLAKSVCDNRATKNYFDVRGWIIVSQGFKVKKAMFDLLKEIGVLTDESDEGMYAYHQLGERLHKHLSGRRFLIMVDDIWSGEDWGKFKLFLPDYNNGSRIILTTRLLNVAKDVGSSDTYTLNFLDENTSWSLLCKKVFLNEPCPPKLLEVGKKIAKNCKGLPLSLSVIGGLLAKLEKTRECWEKISGDINMIVSSEEDERYLKILALSYRHLPIYLKPCFLYLGIFPEDYSMDVSSLIDLWISEGFLKVRGASKSLEEVAQSYLEDLIARSLIYVSVIGNRGKIEKVRIHDLLRDLALREAQKQKFIRVATLQDPNFLMAINRERRIGLRDSKLCDNLESECENAMNCSTFLRSLICDTAVSLPVSTGNKLLRVAEPVSYQYSPIDTFHLINSRHLRILYNNTFQLSSLQHLWNLQIVFVKRLNLAVRKAVTFPIWELPLLRKLDMVGVSFPDPPRGRTDGESDLVLTNLQKISAIQDFICTDEVLRKICNIKELFLIYFNESEKEVSHYLLNNIGHLHKLQNLHLGNLQEMDCLIPIDWFANIGFPQSLKKLMLQGCSFEWEHLTEKVGSLPYLEELHLYDCYTGKEWMLDEEAFLCLKVLKITNCRDLVQWSAESIHYPRLERLYLARMRSLEEIPSEIGEITSLQAIVLDDCSDSSVASAIMILKEQRSFGNDSFFVFVNQKHIQEEDGDLEEGGGVEEDEVQGEQEKKRTKGFVAYVAPILVILGFSYVLFRSKFGGTRNVKVRGESMDVPKKYNSKRQSEADDSWFSCYEYL